MSDREAFEKWWADNWEFFADIHEFEARKIWQASRAQAITKLKKYLLDIEALDIGGLYIDGQYDALSEAIRILKEAQP